MPILWTILARLDWLAIMRYIWAENPGAASDLDTEINQKIALLKTNPKLGKVGRLKGTRELLVHPHYIAVYRVTGLNIEILRLLHTSLIKKPPQA